MDVQKQEACEISKGIDISIPQDTGHLAHPGLAAPVHLSLLSSLGNPVYEISHLTFLLPSHTPTLATLFQRLIGPDHTGLVTDRNRFTVQRAEMPLKTTKLVI